MPVNCQIYDFQLNFGAIPVENINVCTQFLPLREKRMKVTKTKAFIKINEGRGKNQKQCACGLRLNFGALTQKYISVTKYTALL